MRTTIVSAARVTNLFNNHRVAVRVSAGDLGFIVDLAGASSGTLEIRWDFSYLDAPDVTNDAHWYDPADQAGAAQNTITGIGDGRVLFDVSSRHPGATAGNFIPGRVPPGFNWMRVAVRLTDISINTTTVLVLHNPGPASSEASVAAS